MTYHNVADPPLVSGYMRVLVAVIGRLSRQTDAGSVTLGRAIAAGVRAEAASGLSGRFDERSNAGRRR